MPIRAEQIKDDMLLVEDSTQDMYQLDHFGKEIVVLTGQKDNREYLCRKEHFWTQYSPYTDKRKDKLEILSNYVVEGDMTFRELSNVAISLMGENYLIKKGSELSLSLYIEGSR